MPNVAVPTQALILVFIMLLSAFGGGLAYIYLPSAVVTLEPRTFSKQAQQEITLSAALKEPDFVRFSLPANFIEKATTATKKITREGQIKQDFSRGKVTLFNKQVDAQGLLPKTHLRHEASGVMFLTDEATRIPGNGSVEISVTAQDQGASGDVPAGKFLVDKLAPEMQSQVYGESQVAFAGGEVTDTAVTEKEINDAKDTALAQATADAKDQIASSAGTKLQQDLVIIETQSVAASVEAGSRATSFTASATVRGRAFTVNDNDILSLTLMGLKTMAAPDEDFVRYQPDSFKLELVRADFDRGEARVRGTLSGTFAKRLPASLLESNKLAGLSASEVQDFYKKFENVGDVSIKLSPFWVKSVPARPSAIAIQLKSTK